MDAAALDDEQIAAQLHRELNGLTRRAARGSLPPLQPLRKRKARTEGSSPAGSGHPSNSHPSASPAASWSEDRDAAERDCAAPRLQTPEELREAQGTSQPAARRSGGGNAVRSHGGAGASRFAAAQPLPPSRFAKLAQTAASAARSRARSCAASQLLNGAREPSSGGAANGPSPGGKAGIDVSGGKAGGGGRTAGHSIKCFCAGVRWGVSVAAAAAHDRPALATAVRAALGEHAGEACRDDSDVLMLDREGHATCFPAGQPVASEAWTPAAASAVRIYVR